MKHSKPRRSKWAVLWLPIAGLFIVDLTYQTLIVWRLHHTLAQAQPWFLALAVVNQLAVYIVLVPAMQAFYATSNIRLSERRAFSMLAAGLAFARVVPAGEYIVWRTSMRGRRGAATTTTQWLILYYSWLLAGVIVLFLLSTIATAALYPNAHAQGLVGKLRYLPIALVAFGLMGVFLTRFEWARRTLRKVAYDKFGSQAVSPFGIIKDRRLGRSALGTLTFAALATWIIEGFTLYLCLKSLGLEVPFVMAVFAYTFARLFSIIPLTPGGAGQMETGTALLLLAYSYPFGTVFTAALLYRLITYWPPLLLGISMYLQPGKQGIVSMNDPAFASQLHRRS